MLIAEVVVDEIRLSQDYPQVGNDGTSIFRITTLAECLGRGTQVMNRFNPSQLLANVK